nr:MAG TPA: hypothetical protein [Microviridae sp.]
MRNKTIAVIVDKRTGVVKSIETEIIVSNRQSMETMVWECKNIMRKVIDKKKYKILNINVYLYG